MKNILLPLFCFLFAFFFIACHSNTKKSDAHLEEALSKRGENSIASTNNGGTNYYSTKSGGWDANIWSVKGFLDLSQLVALPCAKNGSDSIFINAAITTGSCGEVSINKNGGSNVLVIKSGGSMTLPKMQLGGSVKIFIEVGGILVVNGDLKTKGSSEIFVEGTLLVNGSVDMDGSSRVCGTGLATHVGSLTNSGSSEWCLSLPIELSDFRGYWEGAKLRLDWETASETNNAFFTVERSNDGSNFVELGKVEGAGFSLLPLFYQYIDEAPDRTTDWIYYRLKQTDFDGTFTHSNVIVMEGKKMETTSGPVLYPNPAVDNFTLQFASVEAGTSVFIYNNSGRLMNSKLVGAGDNQLNFTCNDWASGIYNVIIISGDTRYQRRLVLKH